MVISVEEQKKRARKIKLLLLDVDGVMTEGHIVYGNYGDELKKFSVHDGVGVFLIKKAGIKCAILTAKRSRVVIRRAKDLKIDRVYSNFHLKTKALKDIRRRFRVKEDEICYVGDDIIDIPVLRRVGFAVAVANAVGDVKEIAHYVTKKTGGYGAVREICEFIIKSQGKWNEATKRYKE